MEIIPQILSIYSQMDLKVAEFQLRTGLRCPTGCGVCCPAADVQTTVLEMLPAAQQILFQGESDLWLERIAVQTPAMLCVFYELNRLQSDLGHCLFYAWRPAICRLFGFAAVHRRTGEPVLAACKHLKRIDAKAVQKAVECQSHAPVFSALATQLHSLEPGTKIEFMPINKALEKALMRVGLGIQLARKELSDQATVA